MQRLDPNMEAFLLTHSAARAVVYKMMKNAAQTRDDLAMVEWFAPVEAAAQVSEEAAREAWRELTGKKED